MNLFRRFFPVQFQSAIPDPKPDAQNFFPDRRPIRRPIKRAGRLFPADLEGRRPAQKRPAFCQKKQQTDSANPSALPIKPSPGFPVSMYRFHLCTWICGIADRETAKESDV